MHRRVWPITAPLLALVALFGCADVDPDTTYPESIGKQSTYDPGKQGSIFGDDGINIFGGSGQTAAGSPIPVSSFLWRASLDTLSFMPLISADPFGGVIITDWFTPPESVNERFKVTVYILSSELRSDGLRVAVFRQQNDGSGNWIDGQVGIATTSELEKTILTRARQMRVAGLAQ